MLDPKIFERFIHYVHEYIPKIIQDIKYDLNNKIQKMVNNQIKYMNFVNHDEFNEQTRTLCKIQKRLKQLEKRLRKLESINQFKNKRNRLKKSTRVLKN